MNSLSARDMVLKNEGLREKLATMVMDKDFKMMCICALSEISRFQNGSLMPGANAMADAIMQYPFKPETTNPPNTGLTYDQPK